MDDDQCNIWMHQFKTAFYELLRQHGFSYLTPELQIVYASPWLWRCSGIDCTNDASIEAINYFNEVKHEFEMKEDVA